MFRFVSSERIEERDGTGYQSSLVNRAMLQCESPRYGRRREAEICRARPRRCRGHFAEGRGCLSFLGWTRPRLQAHGKSGQPSPPDRDIGRDELWQVVAGQSPCGSIRAARRSGGAHCTAGAAQICLPALGNRRLWQRPEDCFSRPSKRCAGSCLHSRQQRKEWPSRRRKRAAQ